MSYVIPNPVAIACITCLTPMRVEAQLSNTRDDTVIVAVECRCGRRLGRLYRRDLARHRDEPAYRHPSTELEPVDLDFLAECGAELVQMARDRRAEGESWIAAATWARGAHMLGLDSGERARLATLEALYAAPEPPQPVDPVDVAIDGIDLDVLLGCDEKARRENSRHWRNGSQRTFTPAQRAAVSAHWSAELSAKVAASSRADTERERNSVLVDPQDEP